MKKSILVISQSKKIKKIIGKEHLGNWIQITIRYDDDCNNGHNSFSITGDLYENFCHITGGCIHEEVVKHFPEFERLIKWHLCNSDSPMHYIANTLYHASKISKFQDKYYLFIKNNELVSSSRCIKIIDKEEVKHFVDNYGKGNVKLKPYFDSMTKEPDLEAARLCAIWPDATLEQLQDKDALLKRLPKLMQEFKNDIEKIGFTY